MARILTTAAEIIEELGGPTALGRLVGCSPQSAVNWRNRDRLPAETYLILSAELHSRGLSAPPSLWGIREPERAS